MFDFLKNERDIVFLLDDDVDVLNILEKHLNKKWDFKIIRFENVGDVISKIQTLKALPRLIISDINLPDQSGLEILKSVRQTPVIFITAHSGDDVFDGDITIISKPLDLVLLDELIESKLRVHHL